VSEDRSEAAERGPLGLWRSLVGSEVVVDTDTSYVYIGTLDAVDEHFLTLSRVDVHDMSDSRVTKEIYALEAMKYGVRANRTRTYLRLDRTVSVSRLEDVIRY
jgi:small nuclear ribonucleoprotein (snRNP)-like protein